MVGEGCCLKGTDSVDVLGVCSEEVDGAGGEADGNEKVEGGCLQCSNCCHLQDRKLEGVAAQHSRNATGWEACSLGKELARGQSEAPHQESRDEYAVALARRLLGHLGSREPGAEHIKGPRTRRAVVLVSPVQVPQLETCGAGALVFGCLVANSHEDVALLREHGRGGETGGIQLGIPLMIVACWKSAMCCQISGIPAGGRGCVLGREWRALSW